jgi:multimeric flavodoxin WrbA
MQELYAMMERSDGIIFGSPVYFGNVSAQAKTVIDRTLAYLTNRKLKDKAAGAIVTVRRVGGWQVWNLLNSFFISQRMIAAGEQ